MPLIGGSTFYVTVRHMQAGEIIENTLLYGSDQTAPRVQAFDVAQEVAGLWSTEIMPLLTEDIFLLDVDVWATFDSGSFTYNVGLLPGSIVGESLPPFVAVNCRKTVLSAGQEGVEAGELRYGSMRLAGIPESVQDNGILTDASWIGDMNAALALLKTLTGLPGQTDDIALLVQRPAPGGSSVAPLAIGYVGQFLVSKVSTQNSRKR